MKETITLDEARQDLARIHLGDSIAFQDKEGRVRIGTVRIKNINCGRKGCTKCPHESYAYAQYRVGKKVSEKYIGIVK